MTPDEDRARALARWLSEPPGAPPPDALERDVVEAVYALRSDLAPAPRVTAEDILATVTRGPLAGGAATPVGQGDRVGAEVLTFPGEDRAHDDGTVDSAPESSGPHRSRWWWLVGGTGGLGLVLAAAATLSLVALPALHQEEQAAAPASYESFDRRSNTASAPSAAAPEEEKKSSVAAPQPGAMPDASSTRAPSPARSAALAETDAPENAVQDMIGGLDDEDLARDREVIPEVEARQEQPQGAELGASTSYGAGALDGSVAQGSPEAARSEAPSETWRVGLDDETLERIDAAIARADRLRAKNPRGAADVLAEEVAPPPAAGQHAAVLAADDYLSAEAPEDALAVARRGLALSAAPTSDRNRLQALEQEAAQLASER